MEQKYHVRFTMDLPAIEWMLIYRPGYDPLSADWHYPDLLTIAYVEKGEGREVRGIRPDGTEYTFAPAPPTFDSLEAAKAHADKLNREAIEAERQRHAAWLKAVEAHPPWRRLD